MVIPMYLLVSMLSNLCSCSLYVLGMRCFYNSLGSIQTVFPIFQWCYIFLHYVAVSLAIVGSEFHLYIIWSLMKLLFLVCRWCYCQKQKRWTDGTQRFTIQRTGACVERTPSSITLCFPLSRKEQFHLCVFMVDAVGTFCDMWWVVSSRTPWQSTWRWYWLDILFLILIG